MIIGEKRLRKVSDRVWSEPRKEGEEDKRELEWQRSFNSVSFPLINVRPEHYFHANDKDFTFADDEQEAKVKDYVFPEFKPAAKTQHGVEGRVDMERFEDRLYLALEEKGTEWVNVDREISDIRVRIRGREATKEWKTFPNNVYAGHLIYNNWAKQDEFLLEVDIDPFQFEDLYKSITPGIQVIITVHLLSYDFEVDSFLREPWMSRDLLVGEMTQAPVAHIALKVPEVRNDETQEEASAQEPLNYIDQQQGAVPTVTMLQPNVIPLLTGIRTALWVIAGALVIHLFK